MGKRGRPHRASSFARTTVTELGTLLPHLLTPPPGPRSRELAERLSTVESRNVTWLGEHSPVFWDEAQGANVRDVDGNVYLDLTGAFGVALVGHGHPRVTAAVREQSARLVHGLGDLHPPAVKVLLMERLAALSPWPDTRTVLATTGSEAVELALKTAQLATGRAGILAFQGAYHGLTLGSLAVTAQAYFRQPFTPRLFEGVAFLPFPDPRDGEDGTARVLDAVELALARGAPGGQRIGALIVEPVQGRAGVRIPPAGFLPALGERVRAAGALVVADEVLTGMGRTGHLFASVAAGLVPDLICIGKALGGGLPLSACLGPSGVMDAWPLSPGEALHTSTFLGHPLGSAAALAVLDLVAEGLPDLARRTGSRLASGLSLALAGVDGVGEIRAAGLLIGVELCHENGSGEPHRRAAARVAEAALREGLLALPGGEDGHVVELAPSAFLTEDQIDVAVGRLSDVIRHVLGEKGSSK